MKIFVLTGAGVSAESGLGTFRDKDGVWTKYDLETVATPEGFARNPVLVRDFYNARRANLMDAAPNAAHFALARLEAELAARGAEPGRARRRAPRLRAAHIRPLRLALPRCRAGWLVLLLLLLCLRLLPPRARAVC